VNAYNVPINDPGVIRRIVRASRAVYARYRSTAMALKTDMKK
jgi:hypothetical protein